MSNIKQICLLVALAIALNAVSQQKIHYTGTTLSNPNYHHGGLSPVIGAHNIQVLRANRERPDVSNCNGWTYHHQPMLAYWRGHFFLQYLSGEVGEHIPPSKTFLQVSSDGYNWDAPQELFPIYSVPEGYTKPGNATVAKGLTAIMHQRVGFYITKSGRLLTMANYGVALDKKDDPNDGNGIGRVVREILPDGRFGPIYFIYYNHGFSAKNTDFKYFTSSRDKDFVKGCREILDNPLYWMQWVEEADRNDPNIPLNKSYKAFCYYTLPDGTLACLWKHALTSTSSDGGKIWTQPVLRARGFVNSNAKIWGQRLSDGSYTTVYNPSEYRWPLALSTSADGLNYTTLNLVHGEITPMRYGGNYKSYGPQYPRGIQEGNGTPPDGNMWVSYSVNKEDMWISRLPVPIRSLATEHAADDFSQHKDITTLTQWNLYCPLLAPVAIEQIDGRGWLKLSDSDHFDYAKAVRVIPATKELNVSFMMQAAQSDYGNLFIEFLDNEGTACSRLELTSDGTFRAKGGARYGNMMSYKAGQTYKVDISLSVANRSITVTVDGKKVGTRLFFAPVSAIERVEFRTGAIRTQPNIDTPADNDSVLPDAGVIDPVATFRIANFTTASVEPVDGAILKYDNFSHYTQYFNSMESENIAQAIPNSQANEWMRANIPLFECEQANFEQMYYFRWWSLRKHIKNTPVGYGMTEFLVNRTYADKYNLIACAIGHHIYESRWLGDLSYLDGIIRTWYRGNNGAPMAKMMNFSSWNIDAIYNRYLVDGKADFLNDMEPDMQAEYERWERSHRLPNGLYWQGDVQDGMEESISGGRRKRYARPTINSYMYGNAMALSRIAEIKGDAETARKYSLKADTIKNLVQSHLWNSEHGFFETLRGDSSSRVREAIGYIPWYFNLPDGSKYDVAWAQIADTKGFSAPYGMTTAEQRHPEFRTRGVGKCEWDGAIWPFATSQSLTAMANLLNNHTQSVVGDSIYFAQMERYVESQYHRGRPYIGEYQDQVTGYWLKGDQERSRYYNHSTFNDLIITGVVGLRPRADKTLEVNPLIPEDRWSWFCLDRVPYHGHMITILWDKSGDKYHQGKGLSIFVDGRRVATSPKLTKIVCKDILCTPDNLVNTIAQRN